MTSRERVAHTLNHKQPDRPPFDCTLTIDAYNRLLDHLRLPIPHKTDCTLFSTVKVDPEMIEAMQLDFAYITLAPSTSFPAFTNGVESYTDLWGLEYKKMVQPNGVVNYQVVNAPLAEAGTDDLADYPWPDSDDDSLFRNMEQEASELYRNTDLALIGNFGGSLFTLASLLRGMEQWYVDLMLDKDFVNRLLDILITYYTTIYTRSIDLIGRYLSIVRIDNDDYGTQEGLLISRDLFVETIKPQVAEYYGTVKTAFQKINPAGVLMKHSCGDVSGIIDDLIEMGIDILDPVQVSAKGMNIEGLKQRFGDRLCFHGGIDTQGLLPFGTVEEVRNGVAHTIEVLGRDGGYIVCPVHHVEGDVPPENLLAIRDEVEKNGE